MSKTKPLKVHITGVYGLIGRCRKVGSVRAGRENITPLPDDHFSIADLSDSQAVHAAIAGMDVVLHIGAAPGPEASFDVVLNSNIRGTYNVLEACREEGVKRLVYASSIMISNGHFHYTEPYRSIRAGRLDNVPADFPKITHKDPPRPTEPYSASKVYAEGLCRTYFDAHGISTICLRLGYVNKQDVCDIPYANSEWLSQRDCANLIELALKVTEKPVFEICYGISDNQYRWVDIEHTREILGYIPQDSHERRFAEIHEK